VLRVNNRTLALQILGIASILLGLHFVIFVVCSAITPGAWTFVLLTEIWASSLHRTWSWHVFAFD
jgi:hypothetical protein